MDPFNVALSISDEFVRRSNPPGESVAAFDAIPEILRSGVEITDLDEADWRAIAENMGLNEEEQEVWLEDLASWLEENV